MYALAYTLSEAHGHEETGASVTEFLCHLLSAGRIGALDRVDAERAQEPGMYVALGGESVSVSIKRALCTWRDGVTAYRARRQE
jgi:hypothetical protein